MTSVAYHSLNYTIDKVAKWMAASDSQVCLFADDTSVSTLSSPSMTTNTTVEQGRQMLIDRLKFDAVTRMKSLLRSTTNQENNHNEFKKKYSDRRAAAVEACSDDSLNCNQNNRGRGTEAEHRRKTHTDSRHRRQSQPSNSHSVVKQRQDSGDGSGEFKEDKYLERIIERATQEIRSAIYKLSAENKLPEKCHLKMKLSIKPQQTVGEVNSPIEETGRHQGGGQPDSRGHRVSNSGRHHRTSQKDDSGRPHREKRAASTSNKRDHREQRKDKRKH
ncbi:hypothetical protein BOX15_Mlig025428g2 [Macrostomum lignano]|uniref:Uncharacterized protein n=1 Tax=Macrostomum lignano TaxID=282301 RepID=A0A267FLP8_9PLAT|nr:hypothetical protein BOX15_Mlig025428g2 [Macrostomum lignano]